MQWCNSSDENNSDDFLVHVKDDFKTPTTTEKDYATVRKNSPVTTNPTFPTHLKDTPINQIFRRMRWANLGLLYEWTTKSYLEKPLNEPTFHNPHPKTVPHMANPPIPPLIQRIVKSAVTLVEGITGFDGDDFYCEGGIINYYGLKDTLMGHQDRSEVNSESPLVSLRYT